MRIVRLLSIVALASVSSVDAQPVPATLQVVDSTGRVLGPVVDAVDFSFPEAPVVTLTISGHAILAAVRRSGGMFVPASNGLVDAGTVLYSGTNCTGQSYMRQWIPNSIWEPQAIVGPNNSVFLGSSAVAPQPITYNSVLRAETACVNESGPASVIPASLLQDLTPPYQPPFSLQTAAVSASQVPAVSTLGLALLASALAALSVLLLRRAA